jgi:hypothetical protein
MKANIKELAVKAGLAKVMIHPTSDSGVFISLEPEVENKLKEFAKLVAVECSTIADKAEPYKASDLIKKHFGV